MLSILRMNSLMPPAVSAFSPHLSKSSFPLAFFSLASSKSIFCNPGSLQNPDLHHPNPKMCPPKPSIRPLRVRTVHMDGSHSSTGEIHVIVGPMFAGKTSSLLRRIELESSNGSLQVEFQQDLPRLDRTLRSLCYSGRLTEAIRLLCSTGMQVHHETYSLLLQECIFRNAYRKAKIIHSQMVVVGFIANEYLKTKLIILYTKLGDMETANFLFDKLVIKSLVSWNAMIAGYVQKGDNGIALNRYYEMRSSGLSPDQYTFASVLRACAALATLEHGKRAHGVLLKIKVKENVVVSSALVDMYFKCSSLSDGHRAFDRSLERNIITWTALISGYGHHGRVLEVLESFHKMMMEGFRPNNVTFLAVLSACSHGGLVEQGWEYFSSMSRDYGIQPTGQHYATMIDLLGRAGRLKEAYELVLDSPCREHPVIWGALLGACKTHGDIDKLKVAARKYFELEPENSGKYVVLSNAYAAFGLWDNVAEIRGVMRNWGMTKEPGYSRVEMKNEVHFFCQGDKLHRQSEEIYQMIKEIVDIIKDAGYVPDLGPD